MSTIDTGAEVKPTIDTPEAARVVPGTVPLEAGHGLPTTREVSANSHVGETDHVALSNGSADVAHEDQVRGEISQLSDQADTIEREKFSTDPMRHKVDATPLDPPDEAQAHLDGPSPIDPRDPTGPNPIKYQVNPGSPPPPPDKNSPESKSLDAITKEKGELPKPFSSHGYKHTPWERIKAFFKK